MNVRTFQEEKESRIMMAVKTKSLHLIWPIAIMKIFVAYSFAEKTINFLKQPNVTLSAHGCNSIILSWPAENYENVTPYTVQYRFTYQYLDEEKWKSELINENKAIIKLRLHSGFKARVQTVLCERNKIIVGSEWTEYIYYAPPVYIDNVLCVIYNLTSLNCTWHLKKNAPKDTQYSFSLRQESDWLTCEKYITNLEKKNIGCHMRDVFLDREMEKRIKIKFFNGGGEFIKTFLSANIEILVPPINISLLSEKEYTKIKWHPPLTVLTLNADCFDYQIKLIETKENPLIRVITTKEPEYLFTDLDKKSKYSVQIRGRNCASSKFWGEWSKKVYIGKENKVIQTWIVLFVIVICTIFVGSLLIYLWKRCNGKLFIKTIPDPSRKIKYWMSTNEINMQRSVAVNNEIVPITTVIEIVAED